MTASPDAYAVHTHFWQFVDHWQTLIAGLMAVGAALLTVLATVASANREVDAAQAQIKESRDAELHRSARAGYAFMAMLDAAMTVLLEECQQAREFIPIDNRASTALFAYNARKNLSKTGFEDIRSALVALGGDLALPFLRIDRQITAFAAKTNEQGRNGDTRTLVAEIATLEEQAAHLRVEADNGMKRCQAVIAATARSAKN